MEGSATNANTHDDEDSSVPAANFPFNDLDTTTDCHTACSEDLSLLLFDTASSNSSNSNNNISIPIPPIPTPTASHTGNNAIGISFEQQQLQLQQVEQQYFQQMVDRSTAAAKAKPLTAQASHHYSSSSLNNNEGTMTYPSINNETAFMKSLEFFYDKIKSTNSFQAYAELLQDIHKNTATSSQTTAQTSNSNSAAAPFSTRSLSTNKSKDAAADYTTDYTDCLRNMLSMSNGQSQDWMMNYASDHQDVDLGIVFCSQHQPLQQPVQQPPSSTTTTTTFSTAGLGWIRDMYDKSKTSKFIESNNTYSATTTAAATTQKANALSSSPLVASTSQLPPLSTYLLAPAATVHVGDSDTTSSSLTTATPFHENNHPRIDELDAAAALSSLLPSLPQQLQQQLQQQQFGIGHPISSSSTDSTNSTTLKRPRTFLPTTSSRSNHAEKRKSKKRIIDKTDSKERTYFVPTNQDVLCGRGGRTNHHPGNKNYLREKDIIQSRYMAASKIDKTTISQELVTRILEQGGRFLEQEEGGSGRWYEISAIKARKKASQTLREVNTAEERKAKRIRYGK